MFTIYAKDACPACRMTIKWLNRHHCRYSYHKLADADGNPISNAAKELIEQFKQTGHMQFPIVQFDYASYNHVEWDGFRPDKLEKYQPKQAKLD